MHTYVRLVAFQILRRFSSMQYYFIEIMVIASSFEPLQIHSLVFSSQIIFLYSFRSSASTSVIKHRTLSSLERLFLLFGKVYQVFALLLQNFQGFRNQDSWFVHAHAFDGKDEMVGNPCHLDRLGKCRIPHIISRHCAGVRVDDLDRNPLPGDTSGYQFEHSGLIQVRQLFGVFVVNGFHYFNVCVQSVGCCRHGGVLCVVLSDAVPGVGLQFDFLPRSQLCDQNVVVDGSDSVWKSSFLVPLGNPNQVL
mmetsp:Transcript_25042/g.59098  ORF Transcript_25042/g.59098 Transcript_25042/m.59098 type:complete len:250 (+) Transcript_25042:106-855(+)